MINHTYIQGQFFIVIRAARLTEISAGQGFFSTKHWYRGTYKNQQLWYFTCRCLVCKLCKLATKVNKIWVKINGDVRRKW